MIVRETSEKRMERDVTSLKIDREGGAPGRRGGGAIITVVTLIVVGLVAAWLLWGKGGDAPKRQETPIDQPGAGTGPVVAGDRTLNLGGYIIARREVTLGSNAYGEVTELSVDVGDRVARGQILARIKDDDIVAELKREEANLEKAKADFSRVEALFAKGLASAAERDDASTKLKLSQANIELLRVRVEDAKIRAPFDGIVIKKYADVGHTPSDSTGRGILCVIDTSEWFVEADVAEDDVAHIAIGQPAEVTAKVYPGRVFRASVIAKIPKTSEKRGGGVVTVKLRIDDASAKEIQMTNVAARVAFAKTERK